MPSNGDRTLFRARFISLFWAFSCASAFAQHSPMKDVTDSVRLQHGWLAEYWKKNKSCPSSLEPQIIFAMSYFPELQKIKILFRVKNGRGGIISTRPTWGSVFRRKGKRRYLVTITSSPATFDFPGFLDAPVNSQVGILGHELCHIVYFENKTGLGLIGVGVNHISKKYLDGFENRTDRADILRGLAYQLIDWNLYLRKTFAEKHPGVHPSPFDRPAKNERYMSIASIEQMIAITPIYR